MFRSLNDEEEREFREYAQKNDPTAETLWLIIHPVCRAEWIKRGFEPTQNGGAS
jgi:hypothetical protein